VEAFDLTEQKVERIRENAARLRLTNLTAQKRDALSEDSARREQADVLLCDLPCSGLGIIGRKQDIKYRVTYQDLPDLADLQRRILAASLPCLKPGGVLIYSTCTIDRLENEENLLYIKEELGMIPEDISGLLPAGVPGIRHNAIQLLPHIHGTDGFFVARFRKPFAQ
jgi:16S rRNA (cytosine967-C5)-methyltransferase